MFTTKQSDVFYNDQTKEMFVCKVSSISGKRCEGSTDIVYGALPIVYKINKNTNYQSIIYPKNLDTFADDNRSDLYSLLPSNYYGDNTNFSSITKPLINYNKTSDRYSVTCIGRYSATSDGFGVLSYIFQYIDTDFYLLDSRAYLPKDKAENDIFTFKNGYLNSDFLIGGNPLRFNEEVDTSHAERVTDYLIKPTHVDYNDSLGFNLMAYCRRGVGSGTSESTCLTATRQHTFQWSGGHITYNPKYAAFDPNYDIRVDFTAKSFNVPSMTAYRSIQSNSEDLVPSRWIDTATALSGLSGAGEGFCAFFYRNPLAGVVEPQGIGSTLGYAKASSVVSEIEGELKAVEGLVINNAWAGPTHKGYGEPANSFLGVGFDIKGDFCTTSEGKEGWLSAGGGPGRWSHGKHSGGFTNTTAPCSVGIRGNRDSFTRVLTCISISTVAASAVSMHQQSANSTGSDVDFQDYRIDLTHKGTRVTVYNKLTSTTDYNTILQFDLNSVKNEKGIFYSPWGGFYNQQFNPPGYPTRGTVVPLPIPGGGRTPASKYPGANVPRAISKMAYTHPGVVIPGRNTGWFDPEYPDAGRPPHDPGAPGDPVTPPTVPVAPISPDPPVSPELPVDPEETWTPTYPDPGGLLPGQPGPNTPPPSTGALPAPGGLIPGQPQRPPGPQYDRPRRPWQPESTDEGIIIEMTPSLDITPSVIPAPYNAPITINIDPPPIIIDIDDDIKLYPSGRTPSQGLIAPINVGLSFTTSEYTSHFELLSFKVTGVRMGNPTKSIEKIDNITTVEYLEESSANLRRDLVTMPTGCPVDVKMLIKRQTLIDRITLCGTIPRWSDSEVEAKWTGVKRTRDDIPGPPAEDPEVITPTTSKCSGWFLLLTETEPGAPTDNRPKRWLSGWHRTAAPIFGDMLTESIIKGRKYAITWETSLGGEGLILPDYVPIDYIREESDMMFNKSFLDLASKISGIEANWNFEYFEKGNANHPTAPTPSGEFTGTWVKEAVWLNDEEATLLGACGAVDGDEEEDFPVNEPISKIREGQLGRCSITTWDIIQTDLRDYRIKCEDPSPKVVNEFLGYTTTNEDKTEIENQKWGQLFGRVEYYPYDQLSYKADVNNEFPNGITFFRKWGSRISHNNTISWGDCFVVHGNVLHDAMKEDQPGGHGAAMWYDADGFAYKDHTDGTEYTNSEAWKWREAEGIPNTQNSNLGFTEHSPQSDDSLE